MSRRTNLFLKLPENTLRQLVAGSKSIGEVFDKLKIRRSGAYYKIFKRVTEERKIDTSHFTGHMPNLGKTAFNARSIEDVFAVNTNVSSSTLRGKIKKHKLLPYCCAVCKSGGEWLGKPLVLPLDHINGDRNDNRIENLRFLCPNCHSQTPTFCGRARKTRGYTCPDCQRAYKGYGRRCRKCASKASGDFNLNKKGVSIVAWPDDETLREMLWKESVLTVAKHLGCSEGAIRKRCKRNAVSLPPVGYWTRRYNGYSHEEALISQKKVRAKAKRISDSDIERASEMIRNGASLREAAKSIGVAHASLSRRLKGTEVASFLTHGNAIRFQKYGGYDGARTR